MTNKRPIVEEQYTKGNEHVLNYVVYRSTSGAGNDEVLQHKLFGTTETAHLTLHPDGTVNLRDKRGKIHLKMIVMSNLAGFLPQPSQKLKQFLLKVRHKI